MYEKVTAIISMFINQNYKGNIVISKQNIDKCHTTKISRGLAWQETQICPGTARSTKPSFWETSQLCQGRLCLPAGAGGQGQTAALWNYVHCVCFQDAEFSFLELC